jgi:hypothetical protein
MPKTIPVQQAVGTVLCHDITRIVPGQSKGPAFRKGHVIREADVPLLLEIGKEHVFVLEMPADQVHENEAAQRLAAAAAGPGIRLTDPAEGRVNLVACQDGLLQVNVAALDALNTIEDVVFGTLHTRIPVKADQPVAGTRVVPLIFPEARLLEAEHLCRRHGPLVAIHPYKAWQVGMITTGSEVYHGRIQDAFGPVVRRKFEELGSRITRQILVSDSVVKTVAAIGQLIAEGAQMVVLTGGMSVDPDDQTPASIRASGAEVVTYGAPVFPGAMFMLAYLGEVPVLGLPGCVMYYQASIFDLIVPRILTGERLARRDIVALGHGGFCAACAACRYPLCGFGKN